MFRWTKANVSCSNLSVAVTYEHVDFASSSSRIQLIGGGGAPGEPGKYSLDTHGHMVLEDPRAGPAALSRMLALTPRHQIL
jgi:hypothetical protein